MATIAIKVLDQHGHDTHSGINVVTPDVQASPAELLDARDHMLGRLRWLGIRVTEAHITARDEIKIWRA